MLKEVNQNLVLLERFAICPLCDTICAGSNDKLAIDGMKMHFDKDHENLTEDEIKIVQTEGIRIRNKPWCF